MEQGAQSRGSNNGGALRAMRIATEEIDRDRKSILAVDILIQGISCRRFVNMMDVVRYSRHGKAVKNTVLSLATTPM